jgi:hypothetical protein
MWFRYRRDLYRRSTLFQQQDRCLTQRSVGFCMARQLLVQTTRRCLSAVCRRASAVGTKRHIYPHPDGSGSLRKSLRCRQRYPDSKVEYKVADLFSLPEEWVRGFNLVYECNTIQILKGTHIVISNVASINAIVVLPWVFIYLPFSPNFVSIEMPLFCRNSP